MSVLTRIVRAADPTNVERHTWKVEDTASSVLGHLRQMLTTRAGGSLTCPDFGVPDVTHLLHDMAEATAFLQRSVKTSIQLYETRLKNVQVRPLKIETAGQLGILLEISGHILLPDGKRQALRFGTTLNEKGQVSVEEL